jgi:phosphatidate cytidylyltransferase
MAFNWKTFQTRTLTAIVFAAVMLTGLLWDQWSFLILFSIIHFGCWWEYFNLLEKIYHTKIDIAVRWLFMICGYTLIVILFLRYTTYDFWIGIGDFKLSLKWTFWAGLLALLFVFLFQNKTIPNRAKWVCLGGLAYISLSWGLMMNLRNYWIGFEGFKIVKDFGYTIPILIVASIWINDTMAYIVGSLIGKTQLSKISPKKTWEGTIGGLILAIVVVGFLFLQLAQNEIVYPFVYKSFWFIVSAIAAVTGTIGDLLESKLKRMAAVKDSGNFMPGHGGFLDRFDSLLLATPAVWLYVYFLMR